MAQNKAIVTGAGVVGGNMIRFLDGQDDWDVIVLCRRVPEFEGGFEHISVDLCDLDDCAAKLSGLIDVTHIFHAARVPAPNVLEEEKSNQLMFVNLVDTVESVAAGLQHISIMHGSKWYGCHLGPYRTPTRESDPGHMPPNFYFSNMDYIVEKQNGKTWTWSALRPHIVSGYSVGNPFNLICLIAVYAAISKELGLPLRFPGTPDSYARLTQATEVGLLNRLMLWAATHERCGNQHFNVTNGDYYRWEQVWPQFAEFFDMDIGPVQHISLAQMMSDKGPLWDDIVEKHGLAPHKLADLVYWPYGDFHFNMHWDDLSPMTKARSLGFLDFVDTEIMFRDVMQEFRDERVIP